MVDRSSTFTIGFAGDTGDLPAFLTAIKGQFRSTVADLEATTNRVKLFADVETKVKASAEALFDASTKAKLLAAELDKVTAAGGKATPELVAGLKAANAELKTAESAYNRNVDAITRQHNALTRLGVDTSNAARAQLQLTESLKLASAAQDQQAAKNLLNVKTLQDIQPQIQKLNAAYLALRDSGKLSATEIAAAQQALQQRLKETNASVTTLSGGFKASSAELTSFLSGAAGRVLGFVAVVGTIAAAFNAATTASKEFQQGVAEIGTVTNLTKGQLDELGAGARQLATTIGFDLAEGMKALFEIIRSGVPADNALEVLKVSAEAAKASLTDIGTAAKVSTLLLDGFGLEVGDLRGAFDALVQGAHDGGATLKDFAASAGPLLNAARALHVPFNDLVAVLTVMTDASNDAQGSIATLTKIIIKLADPDVQGKLRSLGITSTNLVEIFKQLGEKGIPLQQFIDLGIASAKSAAGVAALTENTRKLGPELDKVRSSAGAVAKGVADLYDSPEGRSARFNAAVHESAVQIGLLFGSGSKLAALATGIVGAFNELVGTFNRAGLAGVVINNSLFALVARLYGVVPAAQGTAKAADAAAEAFRKAGVVADDSAVKFSGATAKLDTVSKSLLTSVQALQAAGTGNLAEINARADAEIAALDRTAGAAAATAAKIVAIENRRAQDRLAAIQKNEAAVNAAIETAVTARTKVLEEAFKKDDGDSEAAAKRNKVRETKIAAEIAQIRLDANAKTLKDYRDLLSSQVALQQQHVANLNRIDQDRVSFTDSIRQRTFEITQEGLSALNQYAANLKEIDRLIEASAVAAANGENARARQLTDEAIARSKLIKETINKDGDVVIGKYEALATATGKVKLAEDGYLKSLDAQKGKEESALAAVNDVIKGASLKIVDLQVQADEFKNDLAKNLKLVINVDTESVTTAVDTIDKITKARIVDIILRTTQEGEVRTRTDAETTPADLVGQIPKGLASGGPVGNVIQAAQRFARGGSVFRAPSWSKVPGVGSGDTVPAALPIGSFVMRKAASLFYGDDALGKLARGFASGGAITPGEQFKILHDLKVEAQTEFSKILDRAAGLPHPANMGGSFGGGQDVRDYVARVLEIIAGSQDVDEIKALLDRVLVYYAKFYPAIEDAQQWHVPLVMGAFSSGPDEKSGPSNLYSKAAAELIRGRTGGLHFAAGGGVGKDTIPAWLEPREWVLRPEAVDAASRMFGGGFLPALNAMKVPADFFDGILNFAPPRPRVAHFAEGGPVGYASMSTIRSGGAERLGGSTGNTYHLHFGDVADPQSFVRRHVIPVLDKIRSRSR